MCNQNILQTTKFIALLYEKNVKLFNQVTNKFYAFCGNYLTVYFNFDI